MFIPRSYAKILTIALTLGLPLAAQTAIAAEPDATVTLSGGRVGAGLGYSWGKGVLHYQGRDYPFRIVGLAAGDLGVAKVHATGEVYNLAKVSDFQGKYNVLSAGVSAGNGATAAVEQNKKGVEMHLHSLASGLHLNLGIEGLTARFDQPMAK